MRKVDAPTLQLKNHPPTYVLRLAASRPAAVASATSIAVSAVAFLNRLHPRRHPLHRLRRRPHVRPALLLPVRPSMITALRVADGGTLGEEFRAVELFNPSTERNLDASSHAVVQA